MKYHIFFSLLLTLFATVSLSSLPPRYLSIPQWKTCVGLMTQGSAKFICLPAKRPSICPKTSWHSLQSDHLVTPCPSAR